MVLQGKRILIVGASRGIGEAIAGAFVREGAEIVITGRNEETLSAVCARINAEREAARFFAWDVSDVKKAPESVLKAANLLGGLDVVVNNAGVIGKERFLTVTEEGWDQIFDINVKGAFFCMQAAADYFLQKETDSDIKGKIIVVSSETGHQPCAHPYGISKWSVMGMCQGFAKVLFRRGVVVQNIAPGPVTTQMMGWSEGKSEEFPSAFGRMAHPEEIADLAVFLASDKSNRIAGQPIYINGGLNC